MKKASVSRKPPELIPLGEESSPLSPEDVICPLCVGILIEPVTLPCRHNVCLKCLGERALKCPSCSKWLGSWSRQANKEDEGSLVDKGLWKRIQERFPQWIKEKLEESSHYQNIILGVVVQELNHGNEPELEIEPEIVKTEAKNRKRLRQPSPKPKFDLSKLRKTYDRNRRELPLPLRPLPSLIKMDNNSNDNDTRSAFTPLKSGRDGSIVTVTPKPLVFVSYPTRPVLKAVNLTDIQERHVPTPNSIDVEVNSYFRPLMPAPRTPAKRMDDGSASELKIVKTTPVKFEVQEKLELIEEGENVGRNVGPVTRKGRKQLVFSRPYNES